MASAAEDRRRCRTSSAFSRRIDESASATASIGRVSVGMGAVVGGGLFVLSCIFDRVPKVSFFANGGQGKMKLLIGSMAFCYLFIVWFIGCSLFAIARNVLNGTGERDEVEGSYCEKDGVSNVDSASGGNEVATPQSVLLAHLHKSLNRSKPRPRNLERD